MRRIGWATAAAMAISVIVGFFSWWPPSGRPLAESRAEIYSALIVTCVTFWIVCPVAWVLAYERPKDREKRFL